MKKYTLKERKKNGVVLRLTGAEWNKIAALHDGEWTTHNVRGEAIGVRYGCTMHIHKDGLSGEFDWADLADSNRVEARISRKDIVLNSIETALTVTLSAAACLALLTIINYFM